MTRPGDLPAVHAQPGLPASVTIYEVGARDGLQAEKQVVPTEAKVRLIRDLVAAGLQTVEATSFVSPKWVPQLADAAEVLAALDQDNLGRHPVLVPNQKGLERAVAAGARAVAVFVSATETFARRNLNMDLKHAVDAAVDVTRAAVAEGLTVRGYVSMCFGDPWEGPVVTDQVAGISATLVEAGCHQVSIGDTIGVGTPGHVKALIDAHREAGVSTDVLALHAHDTYGQALVNVYAALQEGVRCFDASVAGIGGCPFAGSATGNLATEDLLWMLSGLGIETGIDLDAVVVAGARITQLLGRPSPSRVARAIG